MCVRNASESWGTRFSSLDLLVPEKLSAQYVVSSLCQHDQACIIVFNIDCCDMSNTRFRKCIRTWCRFNSPRSRSGVKVLFSVFSCYQYARNCPPPNCIKVFFYFFAFEDSPVYSVALCVFLRDMSRQRTTDLFE